MIGGTNDNIVYPDNIIYPKLLDDYFKNNEVVLYTMPDKYRLVKQEALPNKIIKSTKAFVNYIEKELEFWNYDKIANNPIVSSYSSYYGQAKNNINNAVNVAKDNPDQAILYLQNAINTVRNQCQISSETKLAELFKNFNSKPYYFFYGFESAVLSFDQRTTEYYHYSSWYEGFYYGMEYRQAISSIETFVKKYHTTYSEAVKKAEEEISTLIANSNTLLQNQEERVKELWNDNEKKLTEQKQDLNNYVTEKQKMLEDYLTEKQNALKDLEKTYEEKLRLSKPAEYWSEMSESYKKSGKKWLIASGTIAVAIIVLIVLVIIFVPTLFAENMYWLDMTKNTALLTVITGVAIYMLRITVKLAMSSFHLSRDAKERKQLTYFYLSLLQDSAVTEKERALIINSLFSRSDTGLLKGDSAPSMSANITDLLEKDKSK